MLRKIILGFLALLACQSVLARPAGVPVERVLYWSAQLTEKPEGLGPACTQREPWSANATAQRLADVRRKAEGLLTQDFPAWDQDLYLEFSRKGTRPNGEKMMNARKAWLYPLVLAECVEGKGRFLPAIEKTISELIQQPTWTWPAHDKTLRNLRDRRYTVDLLAADTAHDLAQALYMLGDWLSDPLRQRTLKALTERVFQPLRETLLTGNRDHYWLSVNNNWNAVCLKGVVAAALTLLPERKDRALFAAAGEHYIKYYISGFTDDGYTSEGPGYWNYGFSHFALLREILLQASQKDLDLFSDPKVRQMALYGYRIEMLPNNIAAFGDNSIKTRIDELTRAYANEVLELGQAHLLSTVPIRASQAANDAPLANAATLLFVRAKPVSGAGGLEAIDVGSSSYFDSVGVLVSRPGPGDSLAVSIKAGGNGSHSHNDIGSYTIALGAEQPTGDVGRTQYSAKTFSKDRYTIPGINSWGHPVPVVGGNLQKDATKINPRVISKKFSKDINEISIDMADAYGLPWVRALTRRLVHQRAPKSLIDVTDQFTFTQPEAFEVALTTLGSWQKKSDNTLEFWQKNERLSAEIEASAPWELKEEKSNEEGLSFTRIGIYLTEPQMKGYIKVRFFQKKP
jgi:hypothetical protein